MKHTPLKLALILLVSVIFTSCSKEDNGIYIDEFNQKNIEYSAIELDILNLVNIHRESIGQEALIPMAIISSTASTHTEYMIAVGSVNHDNFASRQEKLVSQAGAKSVGENVAYGYKTAETVVNAWLESPTHRALIENMNYTHFGISTEASETGSNYFTQMFIKR